jgi:hypothetical protein
LNSSYITSFAYANGVQAGDGRISFTII